MSFCGFVEVVCMWNLFFVTMFHCPMEYISPYIKKKNKKREGGVSDTKKIDKIYFLFH